MEHSWDGEVDVTYALRIKPEEFKRIFSYHNLFSIQNAPLNEGFVLQHKKLDLVQAITTGPIYEDHLNLPFMRDAIVVTGFNANYTIHQEWDFTNPESIEVYRDINKTLEKRNIPYAIQVQDEGPTTSFIARATNADQSIIIKNARSDIFNL